MAFQMVAFKNMPYKNSIVKEKCHTKTGIKINQKRNAMQ